ncbi:MAG TPA: sensor histidine kinase [Ktedonobacteraceae bacterium]|nr:sensor histidine kinase [Ktedonobacteraceae bacterium]
MSSRQEIDFAALSASLERTITTAGISSAFITIAIGYLITVLTTPPELTPVNFLTFTVLQVLYCAVLWWLARKHLSERLVALAVVLLSLLTLATGWLGLTGLQWDWLLYLVTASVYFGALSLRKAIVAGALLYLSMMVNLGFLDQWQWSHIYPSLLSLFPAYIFVAVFSLVLHILSVQKERAETLVHQLEESNAELEEAHRQLQKYASEVEELAVVRERTRLAREIHDTLGHYLSILTIQLETIGKLQERDPARAAVEIAEARRVASQSMQEVRNAIAALRPTSIATLTLTGAIAQLGREFEQNAPETALTLDLDTRLPPISPDLQVALYRAVQETLTNVRKHANASKVLVRLRYEDELLELLVLDNGLGPSSNANSQAEGFGLVGLRERIELLGGQVSHGPAEPAGYRVTVQVPVPPTPIPETISERATLPEKANTAQESPFAI